MEGFAHRPGPLLDQAGQGCDDLVQLVDGRPLQSTGREAADLPKSISQKSTMRNSFLCPSGSHSVWSQAAWGRVPQPIICSSLIRDCTGLIKTRLTASGTSMPVSMQILQIVQREKAVHLAIVGPAYVPEANIVPVGREGKGPKALPLFDLGDVELDLWRGHSGLLMVF